MKAGLFFCSRVLNEAAFYPACRATVLSMTALKQLAFSLAFAIAAVTAAQYIMWIWNGHP
jgi:hypothetical protein